MSTLRSEEIGKVFTLINANGSKWAGDEPDEIEVLLKRLASEPLDPTFEAYGNFITKNPQGCVYVGRGQYFETGRLYPEHPGTCSFFGNFLNVSAVFDIHTNDEALIAKLEQAIRANQRRADYVAARKVAA